MLKNIKIATKIFTGFGIILGLLLVLSAAGVISLNNSGGYFNGFRKTAHLRNAVNRTTLAVQRTQVSIRNFIIHPDEASAKQVFEKLDLLNKELAEARQRTEESQKEQLPNIARLEGFVKEWPEVFKAALDKQAKLDGLVRGTLDKIGPDVEKMINAMMLNAVKIGNADAAYKMAEFGQNLMRARMMMQRFLRTGEEEAVKILRENIAEMGDDIAKLLPELKIEENKKTLMKIEEMRKSYLAAAEEVFKLHAERNELANVKITRLGEDIVKTSDEITTALRDFMEALGQRSGEAIAASVTATIVVAAVSMVFGMLAAWFIGMGISRPIQGMTNAMTGLANKNMQVQIPGAGHGDEIGEMAAAVQVFKDNMIKNDQMAAEQAREQEARSRRAAAIDSLTRNFDLTVTTVLNMVASASTELEATASRMSSTAEETSHQAGAVAAAAEQASTNVQTVASAAEELSSSISEISHQVNKSSDIAKRAVKEADKTHAQIQGLASAANKIGEVVSLITDIAEQTNLLALNATIEAARAGDAGKGFAVVASEVKNLANQTAKATDEISVQITGIQRETQEAVTAIDGIGKIINEINEIAAAIASAVDEQGAATKEIARNVEQASQGTTEVTSNISGVNQAASETGSASGNVLEAARDLAKQGESLREIVQKFLDGVRSA